MWCGSMSLSSPRMCVLVVMIVPASAAVSEADSIMGLVQGVLPALPSALICAMGTCTEFGTPCTARSRTVCLGAFTWTVCDGSQHVCGDAGQKMAWQGTAAGGQTLCFDPKTTLCCSQGIMQCNDSAM